MLVLQDPHFSINFFHMGPCSASFQPFLTSSTLTEKIILVFDEQTDIPNLVLFSVQVPIDLPRIVFPVRDQHVGGRTNFVQEVPQDLQ